MTPGLILRGFTLAEQLLEAMRRLTAELERARLARPAELEHQAQDGDRG